MRKGFGAQSDIEMLVVAVGMEKLHKFHSRLTIALRFIVNALFAALFFFLYSMLKAKYGVLLLGGFDFSDLFKAALTSAGQTQNLLWIFIIPIFKTMIFSAAAVISAIGLVKFIPFIFERQNLNFNRLPSVAHTQEVFCRAQYHYGRFGYFEQVQFLS